MPSIPSTSGFTPQISKEEFPMKDARLLTLAHNIVTYACAVQPGEKVTTMLRQTADSTGAEAGELYVTMVTRKGLIKRTPLSQYANIRKSGLAAITFFEGDGLA